MAKTKITELTAITAASLADGDQFTVVDVSDTTMSSTGTNKKLAKSELAEAAGVTAHLADTSDAHDASAISFSATGNIAATDVQAAIAELDTEKATAAALTAHIDDTSDAHDASAISFSATGNIAATDVQAAIAELDTEKATAAALTAHIADTSDAHDASAISFSATGNIVATDVQAAIAELDSEKATVAEPIAAAHIADTSDAHDASAISVLDTAGNYTATDVEAALAELPSRYGSLDEDDFASASDTLPPTQASVTAYGDSRWKKLSDEVLYVRASAGFLATAGTPAAALFASRWASVAFDGTTTDEGISLPIDIPASWSTINVDLLWSSASTGDVRWSVTYDVAAEGGTLNASGIEDAVTDSLASANALRTTRVTTGRAITNSSAYSLRVRRYQSNAADTLAADANLIAVVVTRAT